MAESTHEQRMRAARKARRLNGLNEAFSEQTAIRNKMVELRAALATLGDTNEPTIAQAKQDIQNALANYAEQLYHLIQAPNN